jgi:hypothetical protein
MKYEFVCNKCEETIDVKMDPDVFRRHKDEIHGPDELEHRSEDRSELCSCEDAQFVHQFNPSGLQVCWKGLQWAGKNYKEKKYRKGRSKKLGKKQKEEHHVPELKPNYKGQRTESWRAAKNEAQKDNRPRLETTYDPLIDEEKQED